MKKLVLAFLILASIAINAQTLPFKMERMNTNFNSISCFNNTIFVGGKYGVILSSKDFGKSWKKQFIDENLTIYKFLKVEDRLLGLASNKLIEFDKLSENWKVVNMIDSTPILNIEYSNNNLIVLYQNKVKLYDKNLNLIEEDLIKSDSSFVNCSLDKSLLYVILKDYILIKYDLNNKNITQTNLKDRLNCDACKVSKFEIKDSIIVFKTNKGMYISKNKGTDFFVIGNTLTTFEIFNNDIYEIENSIKPLITKAISTIDFNKITNNLRNKLSIINEDSLRLSHSYQFEDLCFMNKDIIIGVGNNNLISISYNGGVTWKVISYLDNNPIEQNRYAKMYYVNDSLMYVMGENFVIYKSLDAGNTWLPQYYTSNKIYLDSYNDLFPNQHNLYFDEKGYGIIINNSYAVRDTFKNKNNINYMITKDFGNTYEYGYSRNIDNLGNIGNYFIPSDNNITMFCTSSFKFQGVDTLTTYLIYYIFDKNMKYLSKKVEIGRLLDKVIFDEYKNCYIVLKEQNEKNIYKFSQLNGNLELIRKNIDYSDFGTQIINNKDKSLSLMYYKEIASGGPIIVNKEVVITPRKLIDTLFNFNLSDNTKKVEYINTDTLFNIFDTGYGNTFHIVDNSFYINCVNGLIRKKDINNSNSWEKIPIPGYILCSVFYGDKYNLCYNKGDAYGSVQAGLFKIIPNNPITTVEIQTEDFTYFYSYPPFPTPSINVVMSLIYWDMSYNIDDSDIGVYDIYGNKVADRDKISINKLNSYSGYLTWDCSGIATGVYMIQIKHGTNTNNIRAMVVR
ncbi:MAG: hypothetical protein NTW25_07640 [Candidatus Kapabacteria bacterium]|nr:hypothetical protein [Candidatus Kapabacteria bacterium]